MGLILFLLLIQAIVFGFFCSYIAKEKNKDSKNWFWLGFFFSILAVLALIAVPKEEGSSSSGEAKPPSNNKQAKGLDKPEYSGERDISLPAYQLFLTRRYGIEKNTTLEKYVILDDVFDTLKESMSEADTRYALDLAEIAEAEEVKVREAPKREQEIVLAEGEKLKQNRAVIIGLIVVSIVAIAVFAQKSSESAAKENLVQAAKNTLTILVAYYDAPQSEVDVKLRSAESSFRGSVTIQRIGNGSVVVSSTSSALSSDKVTFVKQGEDLPQCITESALLRPVCSKYSN